MHTKDLNSIRSREDMLIYLNQEIKKQIDQFKNDINELAFCNQSTEWIDYKKKERESRILEHQRVLSKINDFKKNNKPLDILIYRRLDLKEYLQLASSSYIWKDLAFVKTRGFPFSYYLAKKQFDFEYSYDMHGTTIVEKYKVLAEF